MSFGQDRAVGASVLALFAITVVVPIMAALSAMMRAACSLFL
ncbi:hypothetical protein ACFXKD_05835 [Nocardiopsis aegyptia]